MKQSRMYCCTAPVNLRMSHAGLAKLLSSHGYSLDSGDVFIFFNSKRDQCKVVWHDGRSYNEIHQRLRSGKFAGELEITDSALQNLLTDGFFGSRELVAALSNAVRGKIICLGEAGSKRHH